VLIDQAMDQKDAWRMIRKHVASAGIAAPIGNHTCRATGITNFLENGGSLENAQDMAAHASPRTIRLYDRRKDRFVRKYEPELVLSENVASIGDPKYGARGVGIVYPCAAGGQVTARLCRTEHNRRPEPPFACAS
jgi:hypothetical protein